MAEIEIYSKRWCPYCMRAKSLLKRKKQDFRDIDIARSPELREEMTRRADGRATVPQIFIDDKHIGGCDELMALERAGRLDPLLGA